MTLFLDGRDVANLAYWVTGTEGSNPSLSATQFGMFPYIMEKRRNRPWGANTARPWKRRLSTAAAKCRFSAICLCSEGIRCHEESAVEQIDRVELPGPKGASAAHPIRLGK